MNKMILLLIISIGLSISIHAQWTQKNSGTNQNLNDIFFVNAQIGYCVGDSGIVLKTVNGGNSWIQLTAVTSDNLTNLYFINSQTGFLHSIHHVYQTTNGGQSFTDITGLIINPVDTNYIPAEISMNFNGNVGIIAAFYFNNPTPDRSIAIKTDDGGSHWDTIMPPSSWRGHYSIVNDTVIYSVLLNNEYKTTDGGLTWNLVRTLSFSPLSEKHYQIFNLSGAGFASLGYEYGFLKIYNDDSAKITSPLEPTSIDFINSENGFLLENNKQIIKTTDGGVSFHSISELPSSANALFFIDEHIGFACGGNGKIYKTITGGNSNTEIISNIKLKKKLKIAPNPAKNIINLQYNKLHIQSLKLTDLSGRVIKTFPAESKSLDVSGVAAGLYFLQVEAKEGEVAEKVEIR